MTRLLTDGAEMGDNLIFDGGGWGGPNVSSNPAIVESGAFCYSVGYLPSGWINIDADLTEFYFRERVRRNVWTSAPAISFRHLTQVQAYLSMDALYRWTAVVNGVTLETATETWLADYWYLIEIHLKIAAAPNGIFNVFIDGNEVIDFTGDTTFIGGAGHVDNLYWAGSGADSGLYFDDLALNDTAGGEDDGWCGDGVIIKMVPDGDGTHNNWHGSDGDDISNYLLVDEYPNDGDLTYVYRDGADTGTQDQYALEDLDWTDKTILRVYPEARARKTTAEAYTLKLGILPFGGVDQLSAARDLNVDVYNRIIGDEYKVNPVDSNPWEDADLDALEYVAEVG